MNVEEAKGALAQGKKLMHRLFVEGEYIMKSENPDYYLDEFGKYIAKVEFWKFRKIPEWLTNWEIFKEEETT